MSLYQSSPRLPHSLSLPITHTDFQSFPHTCYSLWSSPFFQQKLRPWTPWTTTNIRHLTPAMQIPYSPSGASGDRTLLRRSRLLHFLQGGFEKSWYASTSLPKPVTLDNLVSYFMQKTDGIRWECFLSFYSSSSSSTLSPPFWGLKLMPPSVLLFWSHSLQRLITVSVNLQHFPYYWHFPSTLKFFKPFPY